MKISNDSISINLHLYHSYNKIILPICLPRYLNIRSTVRSRAENLSILRPSLVARENENFGTKGASQTSLCSAFLEENIFVKRNSKLNNIKRILMIAH